MLQVKESERTLGFTKSMETIQVTETQKAENNMHKI
jgi:hypothetical protein